MKFSDVKTAVSALVLLLALECEAKHGHAHHHLERLGRKHEHKVLHASSLLNSEEKPELKKRSQCQFPTDAGLVAVTPGSQNGGWAMSPDQECTPNSYCPVACPSGQVSMQWNPLATSYTYPLSMQGGAFCNENGEIEKPFPDKPWCVDGVGNVGAQNDCDGTIAFCQTVLPGNEAMLIPTAVDSFATLAVPGPDYWCSTAAQYIGWNPIWLSSNLASTAPTFGLKITCDGPGCNGLPCSIDPSTNDVGGVTSSDQSTGAGGANFCVATVPKGGSATIVLFEAGDSNASAGSGAKEAVQASSSAAPTTTSTTSSAAPTTTTSASSAATTTSTSSTTTAASSTKSSTGSSTTTGSVKSSITGASSSASYGASPSAHIFFQNGTTTGSDNSSSGSGSGSGSGADSGSSTGSSTSEGASPSSSQKGAASNMLISSGLATAGLVIAVAAEYLL
ncbi:hypothetical protein DH86_00000720 [Scytalidium sp. 3C]|nr:hypothetical protein DH86_00000720 [Scytalidium sp. 3C]